MPNYRSRLFAGVLALAGVVFLALSSTFPATAEGPAARADLSFAPRTYWQVEGQPALGAMLENISTTLQMDATCFVGVSGEVCGFRPGMEYDRLYARDTATILPLAQFFYDGRYLSSAVEEFLIRQYGNDSVNQDFALGTSRPGAGALSATVGPDGHTDKATVTSDEETSTVHSAYLYFRVRGGPAWLQKKLQGETVLQRLNRAMIWLVANRFEPAVGLVKRAHTTDWGDVKLEGGEEPTDMDPGRDVWTVSLYDQAWTYRALLELAEMNQAAGETGLAAHWQTMAAELASRTTQLLWQPERGFFRTHLHLSPLEHPFDEDAMVSIANGVAAYTGLSDPAQSAALFAALENARLAAGASKPGLTLYPSYPDGYYSFAKMGAGRYQNGGLWDWWAGLQVAAEFRLGQSGLARQHLLAIAEDWSRHPGDVAEWQHVADNAFGGSGHYAAAAGTVGEAVLNGLFGLELTREGFTLGPRLGDWAAYARTYQPATGNYLALQYAPGPTAILLEYGTNHPGPGQLQLLLPPGATVTQLTLDSAPLLFALQQIGYDLYVVAANLPTGMHALRVDLAESSPPEE